MTSSKCSKSKRVALEVIAESATDVLTTLYRHLRYWSEAQQRGVHVSKKQKQSVNDVICSHVLQLIISVDQSKCENNLTHTCMISGSTVIKRK